MSLSQQLHHSWGKRVCKCLLLYQTQQKIHQKQVVFSFISLVGLLLVSTLWSSSKIQNRVNVELSEALLFHHFHVRLLYKTESCVLPTLFRAPAPVKIMWEFSTWITLCPRRTRYAPIPIARQVTCKTTKVNQKMIAGGLWILHPL